MNKSDTDSIDSRGVTRGARTDTVHLLLRLLAGAYLWLCFVKLPASAVRDSMPQTWEPVLSFAAGHHLHWGRDIVFTYGPLAFLTLDYYWGNFFWHIMLWAFGFALVAAMVFVPFSRRLTPVIRGVLYV